ncbi:MAG TPA: hypothetical protein PL155_06730 [Candidatus Omnitrophota bacterium]|nr:hypothetical protein [Candidatus Omnitrophota bacterium]HPD85597.1 hypothetical protein [Candidatus Omnitrophota bacterium]HRZ04525.1 hypothetical protein [Candidatus Omnitrophota bacterium]
MEVSDLILADYAAANDRGKFTLVGAGITEITTAKLPWIHPLMFLLVRLKVTRQDVGRNRFDVRMIGEKGAVFKAEGDLEVPSQHEGEQHLPMPMQLVNLKFDEIGDYSIEVRINGELKQSHNLKIKLLEVGTKKQ